jgi:transcriptional regulator GlxA family with amidase domain
MPVDIPHHVCDVIAARLKSPAPPRSGARAELLAAQEVVRVAEGLVLAALPKRVEETWIAQILRLEAADLAEAFRLVRGATAYRAIMGVRLEAARRTLELHPKLSPTAVAKQCGFLSLRRFLTEWQAFCGEAVPPPPARSSKPVKLKRKGLVRNRLTAA